MAESIYIYGLVCPFSNEIKYIGKSIQPEVRLQQHAISRWNKPLSNWIRELKSKNTSPYIKVLNTFVNDEEATKEERKLIKQTPNLFNKAIFEFENYTKVDSETITIKVRPKHKGLKAKLQSLADKSPSPSLNNFLENHLLKLIKK